MSDWVIGSLGVMVLDRVIGSLGVMMYMCMFVWGIGVLGTRDNAQ